MNRLYRFAICGAATLCILAAHPALAQPQIGRNVITFPEQRVCIENPKEISLSSKKTCYLIPHNAQVLREITGNQSYYRYTIAKYNILSMVVQIVGVLWMLYYTWKQICRWYYRYIY